MGEESRKIPEKWRAIHGSDYWKGMLDPVDDDLRESFLLYGDLIQATYDVFNNEPHSKYCGSSRYGKKEFFRKLMLGKQHGISKFYEATRFLYATATLHLPQFDLVKSLSREAWCKESNWIGYVAVTNDEGTRYLGRRDIVVAWRGTIRTLEWADVLQFHHQSIQSITDKSPGALPLKWQAEGEASEHEPHVMSGWLKIYTSSDPLSPFTKKSAREQFRAEIRALMAVYKDEEEEISITLVGHSLGGALAVLSAFDLVYNGVSLRPEKPPIPVTAFVVGCPRVGNGAFKRFFESLPCLRVLHLVNEQDLIPQYPSQIAGFESIGVRLEIDTRKSTYLKDSKNPSDWHNLQAQLHVLAGWAGKKEPWGLKVKRSVALVNKSCHYLKEEYLVPPCWWVEKNKGLVLNEHGLWVVAEPHHEDVPGPEEEDDDDDHDY